MPLFRQWAMGPCFYCDSPTFRMGPVNPHPQKYTRDHLIPRRLRGGVIGEFQHENWTVTCCQKCNIEKGAKSPKEFLNKFKQQHTKNVLDRKRDIIGRAFSSVKQEIAERQKSLAQKLQEDKGCRISGA